MGIMKKEELAQQFAEQKLEELSKQIKDAYLKGYEQALLDTKKSICIDGIEYVDMGLPSGTLWSKNPLGIKGEYRKVDYSEAINLPIPTIEQWKELCEYCAIKKNEIVASAPSCQRISFDFWCYGLCGEGCDSIIGFKFWLKGDKYPEMYAPAMVYCCKTKENIAVEYKAQEVYINNNDLFIGADMHFTGFRLPVFLVKNKE